MARFNLLVDWLKWQEGFHPRTIDLGLKRAASVFKLLNPEVKKPPTIIVAGTNGKGSCIAYLESIYRAQGYRVGAYTSPHILKYNERIRVDGEPVSDEQICQAFARIDNVRDDVSLSYFEFGTLAALDVFWRSDLDIQLLEVGLGGRLDAVNIVDADTTIITSISVDHVDWLGETREAIGFEKAGVFRKHTPAIVGDLNPPDSLAEQAVKIGANLLTINHEFNYQLSDENWQWFSLMGNKDQYNNLPKPGLKGKHQYQNAATVLMAITEMQSLLPVTEHSIQQGLKNTQLKGRFQLINGDIPILLDVAHNPQAVTALFNYLKTDFSDKKIHAVFAMMKDKDITGVIDIIKPLINDWFFAPLNNPRAAKESLMQSCFSQCNVNNVTFGFNQCSEAYSAAKKNAKAGDLILVFGSFFLVSEFLDNTDNE